MRTVILRAHENSNPESTLHTVAEEHTNVRTRQGRFATTRHKPINRKNVKNVVFPPKFEEVD